MRRTTAAAWIGAVLFGADAPPALAEPIAIQNAGFEQPPLPRQGDFTEGSIQGWELYDPNGLGGQVTFGVWYPTNVDLVGGAPEGFQIGYLSSEAPGQEVAIQQTLSDTLQPGVVYKLEVRVLNIRPGNPPIPEFEGFPGYRVELRAGDRLLAADRNSVAIGEGAAGTSKVRYAASASDPALGQPLTIRLVNLLLDREPPDNPDGIADGVDADFDDVTLDANLSDIETYRFVFADEAGTLAGTFSYRRDAEADCIDDGETGCGELANTQRVGQDATLFITEATGDLEVFGEVDFTGAQIETSSNELRISLDGSQTSLEFTFSGVLPTLTEPLPVASFDRNSSGTLAVLNRIVVVSGDDPESFVFLPEPGAAWAWASAGLGLALLAFRRRARASA